MLLVMRVLSIVPLSFKVRFALYVLSFSLFWLQSPPLRSFNWFINASTTGPPYCFFSFAVHSYHTIHPHLLGF